MSKKVCPLFDTLAFIDEAAPACVQDYLVSLDCSEAQQEYALSCEFLKSYAGSPDTYNAYRREVERFLHWCWSVTNLPVKCISRNEIRNYLTFVQNPPKTWIGAKNCPRFVQDADGLRQANPDWRPFVVRVSKAQRKSGFSPDINHYELGNKSMQAMLATLSTYFNFLQQEEYLDSNPVQLVRQKSRFLQRQQQVRVTRKLSHTQWQYVIETVAQMAEQDPKHERSLFIVSAFYLLGLRISELAETPGRKPKMGDFAPDKNGLWWFTTVSKGNKLRDIAVPDAMLASLKRYRVHCQLPSLPSRDEPTPLLSKQRGRSGLGTRQVRNIVQTCFDQAIIRLRQDNQEDEAQDLSAATVHWLRHTAISADVAHRPREHVRDDAGHENAATTEQYIDSDRLERHASAKDKPLNPSKLDYNKET